MSNNSPVDLETRQYDREDAQRLRPGGAHYMAYVGPPRQYDYMGATQFRLLAALGLRYPGARDAGQLPDAKALSLLNGAVLRDPELRASVA